MCVCVDRVEGGHGQRVSLSRAPFCPLLWCNEIFVPPTASRKKRGQDEREEGQNEVAADSNETQPSHAGRTWCGSGFARRCFARVGCSKSVCVSVCMCVRTHARYHRKHTSASPPSRVILAAYVGQRSSSTAGVRRMTTTGQSTTAKQLPSDGGSLHRRSSCECWPSANRYPWH